MQQQQLAPLDGLQPPDDEQNETAKGQRLEEKIYDYIQQQKKKKKGRKKSAAEKKKEKEEKEAEQKALAGVDIDQVKRHVEYFWPREKGAGQLFVLVGKSERGKTHFLRWLLYSMCLMKKDPFQFGLIMVRTKFKNSFKFHWATEKHVRIYEGFRKDILQTYVENLKKRYEKNGYLEPSFLVFDDLVGILNSMDQWMQNFFGTYRHYNITIFIAVQYLTGRNSISPIMREQTSYCIMFNSKVQRTMLNLWENYGQMMPKKDFFAHLSNATDPELVGTKHACVVYAEHIDKLEQNYMSWLAPKTLPDGEVMLKGPDKPKPKSKEEIRKEQALKELAWRAPTWLPETLKLSREEKDKVMRMMQYADAANYRLTKRKHRMAFRDQAMLNKFTASVEQADKKAEADYTEEIYRKEKERLKILYPKPDFVYGRVAPDPNDPRDPARRRVPEHVLRISNGPYIGMPGLAPGGQV